MSLLVASQAILFSLFTSGSRGPLLTPPDLEAPVCNLRAKQWLLEPLLPTASEGWGKVMFSVCPHLGGYPSQVQAGGGTRARFSRGVPPVGVPQAGPGSGTPTEDYPNGGTLTKGVPLTRGPHLRYPQLDLDWGIPQWGVTPMRGVPHLRYPLGQIWIGHTPNGGYPTSVNRWSTW